MLLGYKAWFGNCSLFKNSLLWLLLSFVTYVSTLCLLNNFFLWLLFCPLVYKFVSFGPFGRPHLYAGQIVRKYVQKLRTSCNKSAPFNDLTKSMKNKLRIWTDANHRKHWTCVDFVLPNRLSKENKRRGKRTCLNKTEFLFNWKDGINGKHTFL